jgi:carbamoyltransferase
MSLPLWGPAFGGKSIEKVLRRQKDCAGVRFEDFDLLAEEVAARLADGQVVAWFQGRMEFGPRALGSRSILADPRDREMRDRINHLVKKREGFRPFAPAVPVEDAARYFEIEPGDESTYFAMSFVIPVREEYRERLPAVTHVDGSARIQTVSEDDQPRFWELLRAFGKLTGIPVLLNTSLNVRGQPVVCTPEEAIDTFLAARLDALVLGDWLVLPGDAGI